MPDDRPVGPACQTKRWGSNCYRHRGRGYAAPSHRAIGRPTASQSRRPHALRRTARSLVRRGTNPSSIAPDTGQSRSARCIRLDRCAEEFQSPAASVPSYSASRCPIAALLMGSIQAMRLPRGHNDIVAPTRTDVSGTTITLICWPEVSAVNITRNPSGSTTRSVNGNPFAGAVCRKSSGRPPSTICPSDPAGDPRVNAPSRTHPFSTGSSENSSVLCPRSHHGVPSATREAPQRSGAPCQLG